MIVHPCSYQCCASVLITISLFFFLLTISQTFWVIHFDWKLEIYIFFIVSHSDIIIFPILNDISFKCKLLSYQNNTFSLITIYFDKGTAGRNEKHDLLRLERGKKCWRLRESRKEKGETKAKAFKLIGPRAQNWEQLCWSDTNLHKGRFGWVFK